MLKLHASLRSEILWLQQMKDCAKWHHIFRVLHVATPYQSLVSDANDADIGSG